MKDYAELDALIAKAAEAERKLEVARQVTKAAAQRFEDAEQAAHEAWSAARAWIRDCISEAAGHKPEETP